MSSKTSVRFYHSEFVDFSIDRIIDFLVRLKLEKENEQNTTFVKREPTPLLVYKTREEKKLEIHHFLNHLTAHYPHLINLEVDITECLDRIEKAKNALQLLDQYLQVIGLEKRYLKTTHSGADDDDAAESDNVFVWANKDTVFLSLEKLENRLSSTEDTSLAILSNVTALNQTLRDEKRSATMDESIMIQAGYSLLAKGHHLPLDFKHLGTYGFRDIQTFLSLADPGEGHINITTMDNELLNGLIVHIEHIDRDKDTDKERVEAYRLPSPIYIAKVRLHVGRQTPSTVYVGRPVFENLGIEPGAPIENRFFKTDLLKTVHYSASICNEMFSLGVADCKIAIERMTVTQSLEFMKALVGNCQRDSDLQFLSAAFNINTEFEDDRGAGTPVKVTDRMAIARLGIELASLAGFNKVTWDGASNEIPSRPIIRLDDLDPADRGQLKFSEVLELVHRAHEKGLETYISAGMKNEHMEAATYTGVDGVGIGTSLHFIDPISKLMGALNRELIKDVLVKRDDAQHTPRGIGAVALATLDRLFFEQLLTAQEDTLRRQLYEELKQQDPGRINGLIGQVQPIITRFTPISTGHPLKDRAKRKAIFLGEQRTIKSMSLKTALEESINTNNIAKIKSLL